MARERKKRKLTDEHKKKIREAKKGQIPWNKGKKCPQISKVTLGDKNGMYGKKHTNDTKNKISEANKGEKNGFYGKKHSEKSCQKMRLSKIKYMEQLHGQISPNYNPKAIPIIEQKAKELGIDDLQHAENGGEFHIKELGYWVDGYSARKNIVIEYYEPFHNNQIERDKKRKQEIITEMGCKFIELWEKI